MTDPPLPDLWGRTLRHYLTLAIWTAPDALTVADLVLRLERDHIVVPGRPSKTVSDALRYEIVHRRVRRIGRSLYTRGHIPESTVRWMRQRVAAELARSRQGAA